MARQLTIHQSGLHLSVQDRGRRGVQSLGVPESGALDRDALALGNALVGNPPDAAVLETCFGGVTLSCNGPMRVALTGVAETSLVIQNDHGASLTVPANRSVDVASGRKVTLGSLRDSFSAIIAISGGVDVPLLYGSRATSPNAMIGGYEGRVLATDDRLGLFDPEGDLGHEKEADISTLMERRENIRVVLGPQDNRFTRDAVSAFLSTPYKISPVSNRMGMRLDGKTLSHTDNADIPSDGIVNGSIQVPGDGVPIILLADHQTTGGYTKIATVITADLPRLARVMPGQEIRFCKIGIDEAEKAARDHDQILKSVLNGISDAPPLVDIGSLYTLGDTT
jgi:biotin-dependent carboxylase-like uncharacterized protein